MAYTVAQLVKHECRRFLRLCGRVRPIRNQRRTVRLELMRLEDRTCPTSIMGVSPASGPTAGGGYVDIYGGGFTNASLVSFGGVAAPYFMVMSDSTISADVPAHAAGVVDVSVISSDGTSPISSDTGTPTRPRPPRR